MSDLIAFLDKVFGLALFFGLLLVALLLPVAFAYACKLLKRLGMLILLWLFFPLALCLLAWEINRFTGLSGHSVITALILFGLLLSAAAYLLNKIRRRSEKKPPDLHRIERQPLVPEHLSTPGGQTSRWGKEEGE